MSRLVHRPIVVTFAPTQSATLDSSDTPTSFTDADYTHHITHIVDWWMETGAWWDNEPPRTVYRVTTHDNGMYDIERTGSDWFVYRVWD